MKKLGAIAFIIYTFIFQASFAQVPGGKSYHDESVMPKGKIGERIQSIISTVNSNDPERIRRFMNEECTDKFRDFVPMEKHISVWRSIHQETGGLDFHGIRTYTPEREEETVVILKDRYYGGWHAFVIKFEETEDKRVALLGFNGARTPTNIQEGEITEKEFIEEIREILDRVDACNAFSGAVLIARGNKILLERSGGEASKRYHVPNVSIRGSISVR